ncbi:MAG: hypothetical protein BRC31_07580 [Actinobacteria bacterium QS_5_72_10]|nr:MAG: hypothetical protein BRC31_07580 [Actinobacteria bacterium QS_5_72_10]
MFLALREIGRAKSRFALLGGAVGLLVFVLLFFQSVAGALESSLTGAIARQRADVIAFGDQARRNVDSSLIPPAALEAAEGVDGVADVAAVGESVFTARAGGELIDAAVFGVDPQGPGAPTTLAAGRLPAADGEVAVSATGDPAGLSIGDEVTLEPGGTRVQVVGTVDTSRGRRGPNQAHGRGLAARRGVAVAVVLHFVRAAVRRGRAGHRRVLFDPDGPEARRAGAAARVGGATA